MNNRTTNSKVAGSAPSSPPLEADEYLKKDNSLFDPFVHTINHDGSTSQKSVKDQQFGNEREKPLPATACKKCNYNFDEESECRNLPFQMIPLSQDYSYEQDYDQDSNESRYQQRKKRRGSFTKGQMKRDTEIAEQQPRGPRSVIDVEKDQEYKIKRTNKKIVRGEKRNKRKKTSCKCKKTRCLKSYCECFISNVGCNQNCECLECANWAEPSKASKKSAQNTKQIKSLKEERSCQCKKTKCLKNYCECFHSGKACGTLCNCLDCENRAI